MRLIVHCGVPKTGTTSIQALLYENQSSFLKQGILYPRMAWQEGHHLMLALIQDDVPPDLLRHFDDDRARMVGAARTAFARLRRDIARHKPETVVLSSELFFYTDAERCRRLRTLLGEIEATIVTCAYVRAPAGHYLSQLQQMSKYSSDVLPPQPLSVRRNIETIEEAFGKPMLLRAYDPPGLRHGDVTADFVAEVIGRELPDGVRTLRRNATHSAEAMSISVLMRRTVAAARNGSLHPEHQLMLRLLRDLEAEIGGASKPRLRPEVADAVTRASTELLWLRDERGIVFGDVDYRAIDGSMPDHVRGMREIEQICELDPGRRDRLIARLLQTGLEAKLKMDRVSQVLPIDPMLRTRRQLKSLVSPLVRHLHP